MSIKVNCLNPIAACGLDMLGDNYEITENTNEAEAILVRSAGMHDMDLPESLDRKSTRLNSSHDRQSRMPSSA